MVGDLTWAAAFLIISLAGLYHMKSWGWLAGQMVNLLWLYSMTVIWCRDLHSGSISPGAVLFLPFVPFSVWAAIYLWNRRASFRFRSTE